MNTLKFLSVKNAASRERLEGLARRGAGGAVQRPNPADAGGPAGSRQWTFEVGGTGFEAEFRVAVQPGR